MMCMKLRLALLACGAALLFAGCASTQKIASEDIEVPKLFRAEIAVLHSNLPPNSKEKYMAAKTLHQNIDFTLTRDVSTLDTIFSAVDARTDMRNAADQMLMFYYQYENKSIRFCFYRFGDYITKVEIIEK